MIRTKRVYDLHSDDDGYRILVDRLWPRGLSKNDAEMDAWLKDIAPSNQLRRWFGHRHERWDGFKSRYFQELADKGKILDGILVKETSTATATLLHSTKELQYNNAVAKKEYLEKSK